MSMPLLVILCKLVCPMVATKQVLAESYGPVRIFLRKEATAVTRAVCVGSGESLFSRCSMLQEAHISNMGGGGVTLVCGD